jgi:hypothetical protein
MSTLYKLTDKDGYTYNRSMHWEVGTTHNAKTGKPILCSPTVIHAYKSPLLAELMDKRHGQYGSSKLLWKAKGDVVISEGLKVGVKTLTIITPLKIPKVSTIQRVAFAIYCGMEVCKNDKWLTWAQNWLSNKDRTSKTARYAADAVDAYNAADAAAHVADAATYAAYAAANAAYAADAAAHVAYATDAANTAYAADAAAHVAYAAANAAYAVDAKIDFVKLAQKAMEIS